MYIMRKRISTSYNNTCKTIFKSTMYKCRNYMYGMRNKCLMYIIHYNPTRSYSFIMIQLLKICIVILKKDVLFHVYI